MKTKYLATCITLIFIVFSMAFAHAQNSWAVKLPIKGVPIKMIQASDGGYILLASVDAENPYFVEIGVFKYTGFGVLEWQKSFSLGDSAQIFPKDIIETSDKGICVTGYVVPFQNSAKAFILKASAINYDLSWVDTLRFNNQSSSYNEIESTSNNELLTIGGGPYTLLHKYDLNGQLALTYKQDTFAGKSAHFLRTTDNKYLFVNPLAGKLHVYLTNTDAQHLTDKYYNGVAADHLAEIPGMGFLLLGNGVTKLNSGLDSLWHQPSDIYKIKGFTSQVNRDISPSSDGGFVICGKVLNSSTEEAFMLKADAQGNKLWDKVYFQSVVRDAVSIIAKPDGGNVMFMGGRVLPDMWIVKTTPDGEVSINEEDDVRELSAKVYPNPVKGQLTIEMSEGGHYMLEIASLEGKQVWTESFSDQILNLDTYVLPKGILIVKVTDKNKGTYITKIQNPS